MERNLRIETKEPKIIEITGETILPCVQEIFINEHHGEYLVLNPLGPWWFVGSKLHADFARLCDGKRSVNDIQESLSLLHSGLTNEFILLIAKSLLKANFFTKTIEREIRPLNVVFFNITKRCNFNCPYCYYEYGQKRYVVGTETNDELDSNLWIKLAHEIAEINPYAKIMISGGEPLIRPDAIGIIEGIARSNLEIKLITNSALLTVDMIAELSYIAKLSVRVSIDNIMPEVNAKSRGKGDLEKALTAVHRMKDAGMNVEISATITQLNNKCIQQLREFCDFHHIKFLSSIGMASNEKSKQNAEWLELNPKEYLDASLYALEYCDLNMLLGHPMIPGGRRYSCGLGYSQININPDGSLYPCNHISDSTYCLGNIQTTKVHQLITEGYNICRSGDVDNMPHCCNIKCPVRYFCAGGCRANTLHHYGAMNVPAKNCNELKQTYISGLWVSVLGSSFLKERKREWEQENSLSLTS